VLVAELSDEAYLGLGGETERRGDCGRMTSDWGVMDRGLYGSPACDPVERDVMDPARRMPSPTVGGE
jgi:hypothetical protein